MTGHYAPVSLPPHPLASQVQQICLTLSGAFEDYPWGDIVYKVGKKMFAALGGSDDELSVTVKATPDDADVLVQLPHIERARYLGRYGWVTVRITDEASLDQARDLIEASHALVTASKGRRRGG